MNGSLAPPRVVALAGNPNTGKSSIFNMLTGAKQHVGNWPGKTVERVDGRFTHDGEEFNLVDLPGTYLSLIHISEPTRPAPLSRMPSSA